MTSIVKHKRSSTANNVPTTADITLGELAINTHDGKVFTKKSVSGTESIVEIGQTSETIPEALSNIRKDSSNRLIGITKGTTQKVLLYNSSESIVNIIDGIYYKTISYNTDNELTGISVATITIASHTFYIYSSDNSATAPAPGTLSLSEYLIARYATGIREYPLEGTNKTRALVTLSAASNKTSVTFTIGSFTSYT